VRGPFPSSAVAPNLRDVPGKSKISLAVVQRPRIGSSFARATISPAPDLRFRFELKPSSPLPRASHLAPCTSPFLPLNLHSYYSFLDSTLSIHAIIDLAKRHNLPAIALTDKNNLHGAVEFAQAAAKAGIKPIIGAELERNGQRLCLYVENQTGYHNLCRMLNQESGVRSQE